MIVRTLSLVDAVKRRPAQKGTPDLRARGCIFGQIIGILVHRGLHIDERRQSLGGVGTLA